MRISVDIGHPAHVHYFRNFITEMQRRGHRVFITASDKDIARQLLDNYGCAYTNLGSYGTHALHKILNIPLMDIKMYRAVRRFNPDIFIGFGSVRSAQVAWLLQKHSITFDDSDNCRGYLLYRPFTSLIVTPKDYRLDFGEKHIRYNGNIELAYLHPKYFQPEPAILKEAGLKEKEKYIFMRFVAWRAVHDISQHGLAASDKIALVTELSKHIRVLISSEKPLSPRLRKYRIKLPPAKIHHLLAGASLFFGDGQTMTTEAAILGTPAIRCNSFVDGNDCSVYRELEQKYGLVYSFRELKQAQAWALEILTRPETKKIWQKRSALFIKEKIDVTRMMIELVENYQQSGCFREQSAGRVG